VAALLPSTQLRGWLALAFPRRPGWSIAGREPVESFQQEMERVRLTWPDTGEAVEVFVRAYRGYLSWWTLAAPDLPRRELAALRPAPRAGVPVPEVLYAAPTSHAGDVTGVEQPERGPAVAVLRAVPGNANWERPTLAPAEEVADVLARQLARGDALPSANAQVWVEKQEPRLGGICGRHRAPSTIQAPGRDRPWRRCVRCPVFPLIFRNTSSRCHLPPGRGRRRTWSLGRHRVGSGGVFPRG
jgi:hypothetical protein